MNQDLQGAVLIAEPLLVLDQQKIQIGMDWTKKYIDSAGSEKQSGERAQESLWSSERMRKRDIEQYRRIARRKPYSAWEIYTFNNSTYSTVD